MTLVAAVKARLEAEVGGLAKRVQEAAELSELVRRNQLPQATPAAFVLPLGLRGGGADAATGSFRQAVDETVGVLLVVRSAGDATGARSLPAIDALIEETVGALAGWAPDDQIGVFRVARGALVSLREGAIIYQLDFTIEDQVRIVS